MDNFGEYIFQLRSYECGPDGHATLPTICNFLQEAASRNAEELGFSKSDFDAAGDDISWVLTKLRIQMKRYPSWEEKLRVVTFPRGGRKLVAWRDFVLLDRKGEELGVATTEWMIINLSTRKIVAVPELVFAAANTVRKPVLGEEPFTKFRFPVDAAGTAPLEFVAQHSQIDLNGHVNNVHYIEWMLEPLGGGYGQTTSGAGKESAQIREMEVVFRSETFAGEKVLVSMAIGDSGECYHRVSSPAGKDHIIALTRSF